MKSDLRLIQFQEPENSAGIYEVYYDDAGNLVSFASQPVTMKWAGQTAGEVLERIKDMQTAITVKRWLTLKDFGLSQ
jgi:hypothetical protein